MFDEKKYILYTSLLKIFVIYILIYKINDYRGQPMNTLETEFTEFDLNSLDPLFKSPFHF